MTRFAAATFAFCLGTAASPAFAQQPPDSARQVPRSTRELPEVTSTFRDSLSAQDTRQRLQILLRELPPAVGEVLRRDPSLMNQPDYLAPYPTLVAFLEQHPEIARNPSYFLGNVDYYERRAMTPEEWLGMVLGGFAAFAVFLTLVGFLVWLVRSVIEHRRWLRISRVQTEVNTKIMDRLTGNEDLLAYIQTPAGRRFLESAPIAVEGAPRPQSAPVISILWSLQGGVVLIALGLGMWFVRGDVVQEVAEALYVIGVIATALGVGFVVSAILAYLISSRLGLVSAPKADHA